LFIKLNNNEKYGIIDNNKYNSKWQDLIDLLLKKDYNERPNIDEIYNFLIKEFKNIKKIIKLKPGEMSALKNQGNDFTYINGKNIFYNSFIYIVLLIGDTYSGKTSLFSR
jgi:hypothetical protein